MRSKQYNVGIVKRPNVSISEEFASGPETSCTVFTSQPVTSTESSPVRLEARGVRTDRLESNEVRARSSGFLVLFEQWASKELYSDGKY
jgi:hypothetical protein